MIDKKWFLNIKYHPEACATVLCLPCGGGSASSFWSWQDLHLNVNVWALKLPGRDNRIAESFITSPKQLILSIIEAMPRTWPTPFILYGHSMGAGLAFELILALQKQGRALPALFIAAGREPPNCEYRFTVKELSDEGLISYIQGLGGVYQQIPADIHFLKLYLAKIRADYQLNANIPSHSNVTLPVPIVIMNGDTDPLVGMETLNDWRRFTTKSFQSILLSGDHFFMNAEKNTFIQTVTHCIAKVLI